MLEEPDIPAILTKHVASLLSELLSEACLASQDRALNLARKLTPNPSIYRGHCSLNSVHADTDKNAGNQQTHKRVDY